MSVIPISREVSSADLARVREVTPLRVFESQNDDDPTPATVEYNSGSDSLYCMKCRALDNCFHTGRVRLSGILTHTITKRAGIVRAKRNR
jgi:hypothetical protein